MGAYYDGDVAQDVSVQEVVSRLPAALAGGRLAVDVQFPASQHVTLDNPLDVSALARDATSTAIRDRLPPALDLGDGGLQVHVLNETPATDVSALATAAKQDAQTALLTALAGVNYATGADMATVETKLDTIATNTANIKLDADHLTINSDALNLDVQGVETRLDTLNGKDFATQTTLAALYAQSLEGTVTPADAFANPSTAQIAYALNGVYDVAQAAWQRARAAPGASTGIAGQAGDSLPVTNMAVGGLGSFPLPAQDARAYRWVSVQLNPNGWTGSVVFEGTNDLASGVWNPVTMFTNTAVNSGFTSTSVGTSTVAAGPLPYRYFRVRISAYTAGTLDCFAVFYALPTMMQSLQVGPTTAYSAVGDASASGGIFAVGNMLYGGATADRQRSAAVLAALGGSFPTTGVGVTAIGLESTSAALAGLGAASAMGDNIGGANLAGVGSWLYAGTSFYRQRGDTAGTAFVRPPTASSGTSANATAGTATGQVLAANANRRRLIVTNDSPNKVYLNVVGGPAVLGAGILLNPGGVFDDQGQTTGQINSIATAASSNLAVTEL